eukprot:TRINITY_DN2416_c0_g1_i1.p1 TRINITY_DN2416_c0_g1~~TRINITY_DN2416_c0_g1_i1.p1  ORF type:complete len:509 (-),score=94.25 TRINITY_DN2416_c0_g1_i1:8-1534(-)
MEKLENILNMKYKGTYERKEQFQLIETKDHPSSRYGHSSVHLENKGNLIIIFGGCDSKAKFCKDLWIFNIEQNKWFEIKSKSKILPEGRNFHSSVIYHDDLYIFAGISNGLYSDLFKFNLDDYTWTQLKSLDQGNKMGHTAVTYNHSMYVFGGYDNFGSGSNDLFQYVFKTNTWKQVHPPKNGVQPRSVYHHSAVVYQGSMYTFGGIPASVEVQEFRFGTQTWSFVQSSGSCRPEPRWGHTAFVKNDTMFILGGKDKVSHFPDLYSFSFETRSWKKYACDTFSPRYFFSSVVCDQMLYVFGGCNVYNFVFEEFFKCPLDSSNSKEISNIKSDFRNLLDDPELSDVVFVFPEEKKTINAHKNIIFTRCELFEVMFRVGMKESKENKIEINKINYKTFYSLLEYLYTGLLFVEPDQALSLLQASDFYNLPHLKSLCERKIERYLSRENVSSIFLVCKQYKASYLFQRCLKYILKHHDSVSRTEHFKSLPMKLREIVNDKLEEKDVENQDI